MLFRLSFILTVVAYGIWFAVGIAHGLNLSVIYDVIRGSSDATYDIKDTYLATIPGVTTATEFGLAVIALGVPLGVATGWRGVRWQCLTVILLAFIRAFLNSERLAVTELLVPLVVSLTWMRPPTGRRVRRLTQAAPVLGLVFLYIFFASGHGRNSTPSVSPAFGHSLGYGSWGITRRRSTTERYYGGSGIHCRSD
jgi:predicted secreted protein